MQIEINNFQETLLSTTLANLGNAFAVQHLISAFVSMKIWGRVVHCRNVYMFFFLNATSPGNVQPTICNLWIWIFSAGVAGMILAKVQRPPMFGRMWPGCKLLVTTCFKLLDTVC